MSKCRVRRPLPSSSQHGYDRQAFQAPTVPLWCPAPCWCVVQINQSLKSFVYSLVSQLPATMANNSHAKTVDFQNDIKLHLLKLRGNSLLFENLFQLTIYQPKESTWAEFQTRWREPRRWVLRHHEFQDWPLINPHARSHPFKNKCGRDQDSDPAVEADSRKWIHACRSICSSKKKEMLNNAQHWEQETIFSYHLF